MADSQIERRDFILMTAGAAALALGIQETAAAAGSEELSRLTIAEASKKIQSGEITCTELTRACIERSRVYIPKVNAFITLMNDEALSQAADLDAEAKAGKFRGPLHGVPLL
jgi:aspartyl-tRNA(Asn)/glutamyl-tRNA(Gln) amidotransferase subunit A